MHKTKFKKQRLIILFIIASIAKQSEAQIIITVCGNGIAGYSGDGGQASVAEFNEPCDVIFDPSGNLYIADWIGNRVRKVNTAGVITTIAGTGAATYSGDGGPATAAEIQRPQKVILDAIGNIYILDTYNSRVRKINTAGIITTIAGNGSAFTSGDGGQATAAGIFQPTGLAFDASGNMFIAEYLGNRIRKVNTLGIISTIAGNGTAAYSGDGGPATAAELNKPISLIFDTSWNLYVTDYQNNRIRKINTAGIITTIAGNGIAGHSGDGGQATAASINNPIYLEMDNAGNIFFSDLLNNRIAKINTAGIISTIAGNGTAGFSGDGGPATLAELNGPCGIGFDNSGNLFIADWLNNRIRKLTNVGAPGTLVVNSPTICAGATATLTASGASTYTWSVNAGNATTASVVVSPTVTTTYTVTGEVGTFGSQMVVATVSVVPNIPVSINGDTVICTGQTTTLTANGATNYIWSANAGGVTTASVVLNPTVTTIYSVVGETGTCIGQAIATVSVIPNPSISVTGNTFICLGSSTTLTACGANNYIWNTGALTASIVLSPTTTTIYSVVGEIGSCISQTVATINVMPSSPTVTISGSNTICMGQDITLTANGASAYIWNTGATTSSVVLTPTVTTTYTVTGGLGTCSSQAVADVTVNNPFDFVLPNIVTPNNDGVNDYIDFGKYLFSTLQIDIYNRWGTKVFESTNPACIWKPTEDDGTYFYTAQYLINCKGETQSKPLKGFITIIR